MKQEKSEMSVLRDLFTDKSAFRRESKTLDTPAKDGNSTIHPIDHSIPSKSENKLVPEESRAIERTRLLIVCIAALLAILSFLAFIITDDPRTLLGTSALAYPLFKVVDYYFKVESPK